MLLKRIIGKRLTKKTQKTAFSGVSAGLCVVILFVGSLLDIIDVSTAAAAGIIVFISLYKTDLKYSISIYISASLLSFILISSKSAPLLFTTICGIYPFIWYFTLKIKKIFINYIVKLLLFNALAALSIIILKNLIAGYIEEPMVIMIGIIVLANFAFLLYDYLLSVLWFYMTGCFYGIVFKFKRK